MAERAQNCVNKAELAPVNNSPDEIVYELIGRDSPTGTKTTEHSVAHIHITPLKSSLRHHHPEICESYYILKGEGYMVIDERKFTVKPGDAILIRPKEVHQIFNTSSTTDLELIAVSAPAWEISNSVFV